MVDSLQSLRVVPREGLELSVETAKLIAHLQGSCKARARSGEASGRSGMARGAERIQLIGNG